VAFPEMPNFSFGCRPVLAPFPHSRNRIHCHSLTPNGPVRGYVARPEVGVTDFDYYLATGMMEPQPFTGNVAEFEWAWPRSGSAIQIADSDW
jgi:hypothetical protein